jgi:hypothetical protein
MTRMGQSRVNQYPIRAIRGIRGCLNKTANRGENDLFVIFVAFVVPVSSGLQVASPDSQAESLTY